MLLGRRRERTVDTTTVSFLHLTPLDRPPDHNNCVETYHSAGDRGEHFGDCMCGCSIERGEEQDRKAEDVKVWRSFGCDSIERFSVSMDRIGRLQRLGRWQPHVLER